MLTIFSQFQIAIILAGGLRDWIDFGIICALLLLNAIVGFAQEYQAGNIVDSLKETLALRALAVRNCCIVEINAEEVVVGDIIHVEDVSCWGLKKKKKRKTWELMFLLGHNHRGRWQTGG